MTKNTLLHACLIVILLLASPAPAATGAPLPAPVPAEAATVRYARPGAGGDCASWATACDLATALAGASPGTEIWAAAGVYYPAGTDVTATFALANGVALYGGFAGGEVALSDRNSLANPTVLSGDIDRDGVLDVENTYHVVTARNVITAAVVDGFTITAGNARPSGDTEWGGGMFVDNSVVTLRNVTFTGNRARAGGGLFTYQGPAGQPVLINVAFWDNTAEWHGGGMHTHSNSRPQLINVSFAGNTAGLGGGLYNSGDSDPVLTNAILWHNTPEQIFSLDGTSTPVVTHSDIEGGYAGPGNIDVDPQFVNLAAGNLRLQRTSPAIDVGANAVVTAITDLDGRPRLVDIPGRGNPDPGAVVDLGAYEAQSGVVYVDRSAPGPVHDGASWATAYAGLQPALAVASSGDEIWVADGVYYPGAVVTATFALADGVTLYGGFAGGEANLGDRNWDANPAVLSGDIDQNDVTDARGVVTTTLHITGTNAYHVVTGSSVTTTAVLDGFIITAGSARGAYPYDSGGGMYNAGSSPTVANLTFIANSSSHGGGMANVNSSPTLTNVIFAANSATWDGGGMYNFAANNPTLANVAFAANMAGHDGGGMYNHISSPRLTNVTFAGNTAGSDGGGLYNQSGSSPTLIGVIFSANTASTWGGGVFSGDSSGTLQNVVFTGNTAEAGGGLFTRAGPAGQPVLVNAMFWNNSATLNGGGLHTYQSSSPSLTNVTFSSNRARLGGGIYNIVNGDPELVNAIVWGNTALSDTANLQILDNSSDCDSAVSYSDIQMPAGNIYTGTHNLNADPEFIDASIGNLRLRLTSPAIDAGNNLPVAVATDLDGSPRFVDLAAAPDTGTGTPPIVDMGAYEAQLVKLFLPFLGKP